MTRLPSPSKRSNNKKITSSLSSNISGPAPKKIPRPLNSFFLFRKMVQARFEQPHLPEGYHKPPQKVLSRICGQLWKQAPLGLKQDFEDLANQERARHTEKYPDYKYQPSRDPNKRKKQRPKQQTPGASGSSKNAHDDVEDDNVYLYSNPSDTQPSRNTRSLSPIFLPSVRQIDSPQETHSPTPMPTVPIHVRTEDAAHAPVAPLVGLEVAVQASEQYIPLVQRTLAQPVNGPSPSTAVLQQAHPINGETSWAGPRMDVDLTVSGQPQPQWAPALTTGDLYQSTTTGTVDMSMESQDEGGWLDAWMAREHYAQPLDYYSSHDQQLAQAGSSQYIDDGNEPGSLLALLYGQNGNFLNPGTYNGLPAPSQSTTGYQQTMFNNDAVDYARGYIYAQVPLEGAPQLASLSTDDEQAAFFSQLPNDTDMDFVSFDLGHSVYTPGYAQGGNIYESGQGDVQDDRYFSQLFHRI